MIENEPQDSTSQKSNLNHEAAANRVDAMDTSTIERQSMMNSKYELLSGYLDGELTQQEAQKVMLLLESDEDYQQLHDEMQSMRQEIQSLSLQDSELEHLEQLFQEPVAKTSRLFGFALIAVSSVILVVFILYSILINTAIGLLVKIAISALCLGSLLLLFSVLRQRMITSKNDKYTRVNI